MNQTTIDHVIKNLMQMNDQILNLDRIIDTPNVSKKLLDARINILNAIDLIKSDGEKKWGEE